MAAGELDFDTSALPRSSAAQLRSFGDRYGKAAALIATAFWVVAVLIYVFINGGVSGLLEASSADLAMGVALFAAPLIVVWGLVAWLPGPAREPGPVARVEGGTEGSRFSGHSAEFNRRMAAVETMERRAEARIGRAIKLLDDQSKILDRASAEAGRRAEQVTATLGAQAEALDKAAATFERVTGQFSAVADRTRSDISAHTDALAAGTAQLSEQRQALVGECSRLTLACREGADSLGTSAEAAQSRVEEIADMLSLRSTDMSALTAQVTERLEKIGEDIDVKRHILVDATRKAGAETSRLGSIFRDHGKTAGRASEVLNERVGAILKMVDDRVAALNGAAALAEQRLTGMVESFDSGSDTLNGATASMSEQVQAAGDHLARQAQGIAHLSGKVRQDVAGLGELLSRQIADLDAAADRSKERVGTLTSDLKTGVGEVARDSEQIMSGIAAACARLTDTGRQISTLSRESEDRLIAVGDQVARQSADLVDTAGRSITSLAGVAESIGERGQTLEGFTESTLLTLQGFVDRLDTVVPRAAQSIQAVGLQIDDICTKLGHQVGEINSGSAQAVASMDDVSQVIGRQLQELVRSVRKAGAELTDVSTGMREEIDSLQSSTDAGLGRSEALRSAIVDQVGTMSEAAGRTQAQLQELSALLEERVRGSIGDADQLTHRLEAALTAARQEAKSLLDITGRAAEQISEAAQQVRGEASGLSARTEDGIDGLQSAVETIRNLGDTFGHQFTAQVADIKAMSQDVATELDRVAAAREALSNGFTESLGELDTRLSTIAERTEDAKTRLLDAAGSVRSEGEALQRSSSEQAETIRQATRDYAAQTRELIEASRRAAEHAGHIRDGSATVTREAYLSAAKIVVERLHSMTVDITRIIDSKVPESLWEALHRGDYAAFTRRALTLEERVPFDEIRQAFRSDQEFRTVTQRFLNEFEALYKESEKVDPAAVLTLAWESSDLGGVYMILSAALDHRPIYSTA